MRKYSRYLMPESFRAVVIFIILYAAVLFTRAGADDGAPFTFQAISPVLWIQLAVFLCFSAFFSCSETAIFYLTKIQIIKIGNNKKFGSESLLKLLDSPKRTLNTILLGNLFVNIGASITGGIITEKFIVGNPVLSFIFGAVGITLLLLFFGELFPKTLGYEKSEPAAHLVAFPLRIIDMILYPINKAIMFFVSIFFKMMRIPPENLQTTLTEEELKSLLQISDVQAVLEEDEKEMLESVIEFRETTAEEIMTPRTEIVAYPIDTPKEEIINYFKTRGHKRILMYDDDIDHIVGILHSKHLILYPEKEISALLREARFIAPKKPISELLHEMRHSRMHVAVVVDEFGGTAGIITLNDVISEIVGEMVDTSRGQKADEEKIIEKIEGTNTFKVQGKTELYDFEQEFGIRLPEDMGRTIGGLIINTIGKPPAEKEKVDFDFGVFEIIKMSDNRIAEVIFTPVEKNIIREGKD